MFAYKTIANMAIGLLRKQQVKQEDIWIAQAELASAPGQAVSRKTVMLLGREI
jgi:hypothetical protein